MFDEALDATQALREREQVAAFQHAACIVEAAAQDGSYDTAVTAGHLPLCQRMLRMAFEAGVVHPLDFRMAFQELRNRHCVRAVPLHPERKSLDPAQDEKGIERSRYA